MCKELVVAPCIDLFASYMHHQLPRYYSAYVDDRAALGHNAFAYVWDPGVCLYANPPWTLIGRVLDKIAKDFEAGATRRDFGGGICGEG